MRLSICLLSLSLLGSASASTCPESIKVKFGKITKENFATTDDMNYLSQFENKSFTAKYLRGKRVCRYTNIKGFELKFKNFKNKAITFKNPISGYTGSRGYYFDEVKLSGKSGKLRRAELSIAEGYFDDDGCAFGQTTCDVYPVEAGEVIFSYVNFTLN